MRPEPGMKPHPQQLPRFTEEHIDQALKAAKNPQQSKLRSMPAPMTADDVDECMGPVLRATRRQLTS